MSDFTLIYNKGELDNFINILPETTGDEVYFLSLSARNKYLDAGERIEYSLGRTEMFSREIARDKAGIKYAMKKLQASLQYRRTNNGREIPGKALVVYMNINPSSTLKAYNLFKKEMDHQYQEIAMAALRGKTPNFEAMKRLNQFLMNSIQKSVSYKYFVDIDIDYNRGAVETLNPELFFKFFEYLDSNDADYHVIYTRSGMHIIIRHDTIPKDLYSVINEMRTNDLIKEIEFNKNGMVPVPGTYQALYPVYME